MSYRLVDLNLHIKKNYIYYITYLKTFIKNVLLYK